MAVALVPAPSDLGLHSPAIGPWFSQASVTLGLPEDDLAVPLTLGGSVAWLPPVAGFLSFYIATATRPRGLACLRGPAGPAFTDGRLIAVFEVLPEAGERLAALMRVLPTLGTPATAGLATRPAIRTFALEFTAAPDLAFFTDRLTFGFPAGVSTDAQKLAYLGLAGSASALANADVAMRDLFRPGSFLGESEKLMQFPTSTAARLWVFDARGRAIDPGAAACWWKFLATQTTVGFTNLFAPNVDSRTADIASGADRLTVQLVNPHEGALDDATLARVSVGGNVAGTGAIRFRGTGSGAVTLGFTAAPTGTTPDDLPLPRLAVLPDGRLGDTASLFASGPVDPILTRDHVRVAVLSVERHLIGQPRHADSTAAEPVRRRAADQQRDSTRLVVDRAARPALLATPDAIASSAIAALGLTDGGAPVPAGLVAPALGLDWGPLAGTPASIAVPASLVSVTAAALTGGGTEVASTVAGQQALITIDAGTAAAGAWVRCWTQGFDAEKGERFRLDGGAGVVAADGHARVVAPLADGDVSPNALMGVDVLVVTAQGHKLFADQRFTRPTPVGGSPVAAGSASGPFLLCEEGRQVTVLDSSAAIASGTTVVALGGGTPALVNRLTVPAAARAAQCFARVAAAGDAIELTQPAFVGGAQGDAEAALAAGGATVHRATRVLPNAWSAGFPLPGMERRELVAAATTANVSRAVVGGGAALGNRHGLLAHADGHPMCPAGPDVFAVGADIQGPAVRGIAEYVRERTSANTIALATTAATTDLAVATAPASDSLWAAGLRTVAAGVEAEVGLAQLLDTAFGDSYPFGAGLETIRGFLSGAGVTLPSSIGDPLGRVARALDRRFLAAARGAREGATALAAAIGRAEDLIVIDTPALDHRSFGRTDDTIHLLQLLIDRMTARPGLRVVICLPVFFDAALPKALQRIRDGEARTALDALASGDRETRVAVFSPSAGPGRSLKLATTAVIIDDAWAMVGTTHLWRRGLSYDSSYAVSVCDDRLEAGRPQEVLRFRRQLCADRLGIALGQVPDDPAALIDGVRVLVGRGGFGRLVADRIRPPQDAPTTLNSGATFTEFDVWNPDGSPPDGFNPVTALLQLTPTAVTEALATP